MVNTNHRFASMVPQRSRTGSTRNRGQELNINAKKKQAQIST